MDQRRRHWMRIETRAIPLMDGHPTFRQVHQSDAECLGTLMDTAYRGTIDHEGESLEQFIDETRGTLKGRYGQFLDFASFFVSQGELAHSASVVTLWKERPLVAFSMTRPEFQGRGLAGFLIERSIHALSLTGFPELYLVVTVGNAPAQHLYSRLGFVDLGPSLKKSAENPDTGGELSQVVQR